MLGPNIANRPATGFEPEKAEALAATLNADADGWSARVKHDPSGRGFSLVEIFDEDGEKVGAL